MNLTILSPHRVTFASLPEEVTGKHWLEDKDEKGHTRRLASIEAKDDSWYISPSTKGKAIRNCSKDAEDENTPSKKIKLDTGSAVYQITTQKDEKVILLTERDSALSKRYAKVGFAVDTLITIGRAKDNILCFESEYISSHHAKLKLTDETFTIVDTDSANGVYVNDRVIPKNTSVTLCFGDAVFIMGLRLIVGKRFIAFNNPEGKATLAPTERQVAYTPQAYERDENATYEPEDKEAFYRSPRIMREITPKAISIEDPPSKKEPEDTPAILKIGPSIGMALASAMMALYMISNIASGGGNMMRVLPMVGMITVMILGAVLWPNLSKRYEKKKNATEESKRRATYGAYLENVKGMLIKETELQRGILEENRLTVEECLTRVYDEDRRLFDRAPTHTDFLELRCGKGDLPLDINLKFPQEKLELDEDVLKNLLDELRKDEKLIHDVPLTLSLTEDYILGVVAKKENYYPFLRGLIAQIAALHAPDEVKIVYLGEDEHQDEWSFIKSIPHLFDDDRAFRFLAAEQTDTQAISLRLERELQARLQMNQVSSPGDYGIYYVVIVATGESEITMEALSSLCAERNNRGFSVITLAEDIRSLPKECKRIVELEGDSGRSYDPKDASGKKTAFVSDISLSEEDATYFSENLNYISLKSADAERTLPKSLGLLEMFEAGCTEHLNVESRWKENDPTLSLAAPLGLDPQGNLSLLDVHEDVHGPHGLIAGMTGSGKSETIITYILSMAINYRPDEVSFVLIDYKGGGLAGAFDNSKARLPHLAGTITNLDGSAITRSLVSIQSELKRRQALFNEAREIAGASTIDIYKYQRLRREGMVSEPCPHLFIVADEFAELKSQQPEFMDQLISTARIGRSLGVHLILATQKPTGVVNDQIWSNSRFKICLKVADGADSKEMLKRPDAAELTDAGRYYLMVGYNEYFALGQSAWAGTPYVPKESFEPPKDDTVVLISNTARPLAQIKPKKAGSSSSTAPESVAVLDHLVQIAEEEELSAPRLWLDALPENITVNELVKKYNHRVEEPFELNPIIGELDDPENQRQELLTLPISQEGNAIVYGSAASGTESCLSSLLYSLITTKDASELNVYILDFGSEALGAFREAPQVGDVIHSGADESVSRLFDFLEKEIESRRHLFSELGGSYEHYCKKHSDKPAILFVINQMAIFSELYSRYEDRLITIARDGARAGIYCVINANTLMEVKIRIRSSFKQIIAFGFADKSEYMNVFGSIKGVGIPVGFGKGLIRKNEKLFEFQGAQVLGRTENEYEFIKDTCVHSKEEMQNTASKVPTLPSKVNAKLLSSLNSNSELFAFGMYVDDLSCAGFDLEESAMTRICFSKKKYCSPFIASFLESLTLNNTINVVVLDTALHLKGLTDSLKFSTQEASEAFEYLHNLAVADNKNQEKPLLILISGIAALLLKSDISEAKVVKEWLKSLSEEDGIMVTLFDLAGEATYSADEWFRAQSSTREGLWIGEGLDAQSTIQVSYGVGERVDQSVKGSGWGYMVTAGKMRKVRLIQEDDDE